MKLTTLKPRIKASTTARLAVMQPGSWRTDQQTAAQRGYGHKWRVAREAHLAKHPLCVMCQRDGRVTAATVVDHSVAHRGDMAIFWDSSKWQGLCAHHHNSEAQRRDNADR